MLNVVAHPDDDLLFLSPDLITSITSGVAVRTVFLTAGDAGRGTSYWSQRIAGIRAAYAQMVGLSDHWDIVDAAGTGFKGATAMQLTGAPQISLVFVKLPDGGPGEGYPSTRHQSLPELWSGTISSIAAVDKTATFTSKTLTAALASAIALFEADVVRTQDWRGHFGDGDHHDHHATAYFTRAASRQARRNQPHRLVSYQDYSISRRPVDVKGTDRTRKHAAFAAYAPHDVSVRQPHSTRLDKNFVPWLDRQYVIAVE